MSKRNAWSDLTRHARLWRACFALALVRESQFRANFIGTVIVGIAQVAIGLVPILVLFSFTEEIRGWTRADVVVLAGLQQVLAGLLGMFVSRNMWRISDDIRTGTLDHLLVRPVSPLFHIATRWVVPDQAFNVATGIVIVAIGLSRGAGMPAPVALMQATILLASGFVLITCAWTAVSCSAFWTHSMTAITLFFGDVLEAGRYPVSFFPIVVRFALTAVIPLAFATTFPAQAITSGVSWRLVVTGVAFAAIAILGLRAFWNLAVRQYASASS